MQELLDPKPLGPRRSPPGPVVIWNLIRRCNLTCKHCYSISADTDFPNELSTEQVFEVMDDLKRFRVPVLILSGGEPLLRPDRINTGTRNLFRSSMTSNTCSVLSSLGKSVSAEME